MDAFGLVGSPLQMGAPEVSVSVDPVLGVVGSAIGAFLTTLLVGLLLRALAPDYLDDRMADVREDPVGTFLYGLVALVGVALLTVLLAITIVGIVVAIPLALVAYVVWAVGAAVAYLAIGDALVGHEDGWTKPLVVGAAIAGGLALTGVGGIIAFGVGAVGFGAVLQDYFG